MRCTLSQCSMRPSINLLAPCSLQPSAAHRGDCIRAHSRHQLTTCTTNNHQAALNFYYAMIYLCQLHGPWHLSFPFLHFLSLIYLILILNNKSISLMMLQSLKQYVFTGLFCGLGFLLGFLDICKKR
jgi:hypothetical protein